jgi:hypothetical protein
VTDEVPSLYLDIMKVYRGENQVILDAFLSWYMTDNVVGLAVVASFMLWSLLRPEKIQPTPTGYEAG